jgi:Ca-activated chloride channel family protein
MVFVLFTIVQVSAQQKTITGIVTSSSDGIPLPGVNVIIKGTTTGTQTNFNGLYTISAKTGDVLNFTYVGMKSKDVTVGKSTTLDVVLEEDYMALEEVVVTGYVNTRKQSVTSSVTTVKSESISKGRRKKKDIANTLAGQVSGVKISTASGQPSNNATIIIRGRNSLSGGNEPLYIVDGVPVASIDALNKKDIKSTSVLKDAAATSIYGNRGANGVILITTKKGNYTYPQIEEVTNESYGEIVENQFENVSLSPLSTFSIDVDKASYSNIRRMINNGQKIPADAVKIEEMINYFNYQYPQPKDEHPFSIHTEVSKTLWNTDTKIVKIGLQGKTYENDQLPASNLTFLIDVSGSMSNENKLPLLKSAFKLLVNQLREKDKVAIVVYAGAAGMVLSPTSGANKEAILSALDHLNAGGSTAGGAGIQLAYKIAQENFVKNGNNRVILATDGDFNVGASSDKDMEQLIEEKRQSGVFLSVLGFGYGNYKDSKLETLADKGNGNHAYIDTMQEAQKVFGKEFGGTLYTIAKDVKIQIEFNPNKVQAYRLIGYENRLLNDEDFIDDTKDAGELGSGHTVTALYEVIPVGVKSEYLKEVDDLKYTKTEVSQKYSDELFTVKFRYKKPDGDKSIEMVHIQKDEVSEPSEDLKFASSVALLGMQLRNSKYHNASTIKDVIALANDGRGIDINGYRAEFIRLVESYQSL